MDDKVSESEKPPSHKNVNTGSSSWAPCISSSHANNNGNYVNKLEMPRTGLIPSNQKPFSEQIHHPELQATIFVPGTVGSLPDVGGNSADIRINEITNF